MIKLVLPNPSFNINESIERLIKAMQELTSFGPLPAILKSAITNP